MSILQRLDCSKTRHRAYHSARSGGRSAGVRRTSASHRPARGLLPKRVRVEKMLDRSLGGFRCLTARPIAHHGGYLPGKLAGTIRYTTENLGRTLVHVDFDSGESLMVLPDDVILDADPEHNVGDGA